MKATIQSARIEDISGVVDRWHAGQIEGCVVVDCGK